MLSPALQAAADRAGAASPTRPEDTVPGRLLLIDGDALAYYCAGGDSVTAGLARQNVWNFIRMAQRAVQPEETRVLLTSRGSHKGQRYAIARAKAYQGNRTNVRRPKNWEHLREWLESCPDLGHGVVAVVTGALEADDLFASMAQGHPDCVILTQDKDMRMIPGTHLNWSTLATVAVPPGVFRERAYDKVYGRAWFWEQVLAGDTADNIPGLPWHVPQEGAAPKRCGHVTAASAVAACASDQEAFEVVSRMYESHYGARWMVELLEQAILLWLRTGPQMEWLNVAADGNPLEVARGYPEWPAAVDELTARVGEAATW